MTKTIYYAHPMSWYDTDAEAADLHKLADYGKVINPNSSEFKRDVDVAKRRNWPIMQVFADFIRIDADVVVYRRFRDGRLGAGVAREILEARIWGKTVWEIAGGQDGGAPFLLKVTTALQLKGQNVMDDVLTVDETRDRIQRGEL